MIPKNTKIRSLLLLATLGLSVAAQAGEDYSKDSRKNVIQAAPRESRFYLSLAAGGEFDIHATKFISNGGGNFGSAATPLFAKVQSRDFTATHDPAVINGRLEAGYLITPNLSVFASFTYSHSEGMDSRRVGRISDPTGAFGTAGGVYNLYADVSEYEAYSGSGGFKLTLPRTILDFIHAPKMITPYVSGSVGGKYLESSSVRFFGGTGRFLNTPRVELYDDSFVLTTELNLGYDIKLTRNFSVVFESGYGYDSKPDRSENEIRALGLDGVNKGGDRLYSTVSLGGKVTF